MCQFVYLSIPPCVIVPQVRSMLKGAKSMLSFSVEKKGLKMGSSVGSMNATSVSQVYINVY